MPIYEYQCLSCHYIFEERQGFDDAPTEVCPQCGQPVKKIMHVPRIVFKGSGFYQTDHSRGHTAKPKAQDKSTESTSSATAADPPKTDQSKVTDES